jgi:hypothetical protein
MSEEILEEKYFCRNCGDDRNHKLIYKHELEEKNGNIVNFIQNYMIIECLGCDCISFLRVGFDPDEIDFQYDIFPNYLKDGKELKNQNYIPKKIRYIYQETISALKSDSKILAAGGLRAIIEATCNHLDIGNGDLQKKIDSLHNKGHISRGESDRLHSIRFIGNDALHDMEIPKEEQLYALLDIVNQLLAHLFINDRKLSQSVETMVKTYMKFKILLFQSFCEDMINKELTLKQILSKKTRRLTKENFIEFEKRLKEDIKERKIKYLEIVKEEVIEKTGKENKITVYKFISKPNKPLFVRTRF